MFRWVSILSMTSGSSMQAMTLTVPAHFLQVSTRGKDSKVKAIDGSQVHCCYHCRATA